MYKKFCNLVIAPLLLLSYSGSFGMLVTQAKTFHWKDKDENATPQETFLPQDLLIGVSAFDRQARHSLQPTCKTMQKMLSIKSPHGYALLRNPLFRANEKDMVFIGFNAAWDGNVKALKFVLKNTDPEKFNYGYNHYGYNSTMISRTNPKDFGFYSIIDSRMGLCDGQGPQFDVCLAMDKMVKEYKCDFGCVFGSSFKLAMASYLGDADLLVKMGMHYPYPHRLLEEPLFIAIDKNNPYCIEALAHCIKNNNINKENVSNTNNAKEKCDIFKNALALAMHFGKNKAFEALVRTDICDSLNSIYQNQEGQNVSMLDWVIENDTSESQCYAHLYRQCGGKPYAELSMQA